VLRLHVPSPEEFWVRRGWLLDPEMMSFNAGWRISYAGYDPTSGCVEWPEADWPAFERRLAMPASEQGYFYVEDGDVGEFLGHVHYEVDGDGVAHIGLNVIPMRRRNGLGVQFMSLLLERIWTDTDAAVVVNDFEDERVAAVRLHRACGFVPDPTTSTAFGRPTRTWRLPRQEPAISRYPV
jgi:GNAT superfamily N-acetyltransferase